MSDRMAETRQAIKVMSSQRTEVDMRAWLRRSAAHRQTHAASPQATAKKARQRKWWWGGGVVSIVVLLVWAAPWVIANTELRNSLVAWLLRPDSVTIRSAGAELSWLQPVKIEGLEVELPREDLQLQVGRVALDDPWWQVLWNSPRLGTVRLERPVIEVGVEELLKPSGKKSQTPLPPLSFQTLVENATIRMRAESLNFPVVEIEQVNVLATVTNQGGESVLRLGRTQFLDRYPLSPELCDRGLQLIAPVLANISRVEGNASLEFESLKFPLGGSDELMDVRGTLQLHHVTTGLKNPVVQRAVARLVGLFELRMPDTLQIADETIVRFAVRDDRVYHESLQFQIPALTGDRDWHSQGSVGFDESLDVQLEAPLPVDKISNTAMARLLSARPLRLHIEGTLRDPRLTTPEDAGLIEQLTGALIGTDEEDDFETTLDRVEAALEAGESVLPVWQWAAEYFGGQP